MSHDIMLEIDLVMFRGLLKQGQSAKADQIVIRIFIKEAAGKTISKTQFSVQGEFEHNSYFCHEVSKDEDGSMVVRAANDSESGTDDTDDMDRAYEGIFPVDKVAGFVKPLQCRMIVAKAKQDMPIMFSHYIGGSTGEGSHVHYLIAPVNPDTD